ncbi:hypothetical protein BH11PSE11_BH11PSE11_14020 [soil metagenome]
MTKNSIFGAAHDPVIMIPGMTANASAMNKMENSLKNEGWPSSMLFRWTDSSKMTQDLANAAMELGAKVDQVLLQTGATKVVLSTWSASTLAARYYIKNLGGESKVSQYIALSGPQHGTSNNDCQEIVSCQQFGNAESAFLTALNAATEVPGSPSVRYLTIRSVNDINVVPTDSAMLAGAHENFLMDGPDAPSHYTIAADEKAIAKIISFIKENE